MNANQSYKHNKERILGKWLTLISDGYINGIEYIKGSHNQFANPVSYIYNTTLPLLIEVLLSTRPMTEATDSLKQIMQIRAVQFNMPSEATSFLTDLRTVICGLINNKEEQSIDLQEFDSKLIQILTLANDYYYEYKAKAIEIKHGESTKTFGKMIERLNSKYSDNYDN